MRLKTSSPLSSSLLSVSGMINPAFINFPEEELYLGRIVIGYGELEILLIHLSGVAINQKWPVLDACHSVRTETGKIDIAVALAKDAMRAQGLGDEFDLSVKYLRHCLTIRNNYAHAHWGEFQGTLKFMKADRAFERPLKPVEWRELPLDLIKQQEAFFENTRKWLLYLLLVLEARAENRIPYLNKPKEMQLPNFHKPLPTPGRIPKGKGNRGQPQSPVPTS